MLIKQTYKNRMAVPRGVHPIIKSNVLACPRSILHSVTFQGVSTNFAHGAKNGNSKLTEKDIDAIHGMIADGVPNTKIAPQFGVTHQLVSKIRKGSAWGTYESP